MPTHVCERGDLFFRTMINGKGEYLYQNLGGKPVCRSARVQKVCYAPRRDPQDFIQFSNL